MACACKSGVKHPVALIEIQKHNEEIYSYIFNCNHICWNPGDSSELFLEYHGKTISRKLSYASLTFENNIRFTTRIKNDCSDFKKALLNLSLGQKVFVSDPLSGLNLSRNNSPLVVLSNGVGIAVSRTFLKNFEKDSFAIPQILQINIDRNYQIFQEEFSQLEENNPKIQSIYVSNRTDYYRSLSYEVQKIISESHIDPTFYIVGSDSFVIDTMNYLKSLGFGDETIIIEKHILSSVCGCSSDGGCGCGSNTPATKTFTKLNTFIEPIIDTKFMDKIRVNIL